MELILTFAQTSPKVAFSGVCTNRLHKPKPQHFQGLFGDSEGLCKVLILTKGNGTFAQTSPGLPNERMRTLFESHKAESEPCESSMSQYTDLAGRIRQ